MVGTAGGRGEAAGRRRRGEDGERSAALGPGLRARGGGEDPSLRRGSRGSHYDERSHLHDAFTQMTHALQELAAAQGSFEVAFPDAAEKMKKVITQLKEAQACFPPCGLQEFARRFLCSGCYSRVCDLPLDCPVQDVTVIRGDQAMFSCIVNFPLPKEEITYSWKFAGGGLRTQDLSYFRDMPRAEGYLARIRPAQLTHRGTFSCVIKQDQRPLARLYFFLNGYSFDGTAVATNKGISFLLPYPISIVKIKNIFQLWIVSFLKVVTTKSGWRCSKPTHAQMNMARIMTVRHSYRSAS
ncbi:PREDICTED: uncharacterized protein LOC105595377 isoform X6 [Cercocebus atys]|uniref:uncharacterized protein LOC105595377 isoform X6 n=1 Tax=Cercocebus atys TaxID=9531 RepID=UPI0005F57A82|nr:PREDICTED: uncharacterized protein LOC105595377 isoform X6 [Cercocebus atys]